ncbi:hypothetical protein B0H10DRAFT_2198864 [Mycena sp. CBHHK59/15]|nr:hypothetical protein B0H10DRAFT_2198864 [Mycena sp. CBHHK59/15]
MSKLFTQMQSSKISPVAIKLFKIRKVLGFIKQRGDDFRVRAGVLEGIMKKLEQPYSRLSSDCVALLNPALTSVPSRKFKFSAFDKELPGKLAGLIWDTSFQSSHLFG